LLLLRLFLTSIAVNALLGIWALLIGSFGELQGKVLATSLLLSAAMLAVLINSTPLQRRSLWPTPLVAAASGAGGFALFIVLMWLEVDHEIPLKLAVSSLMIAATASLAGLIALVALLPHHQPIGHLENGLLGALLAVGLWVLWIETNADWVGRLVGVLAVLVAAVTLAIPALWWFGSRQAGAEASDSGPARAHPPGHRRPVTTLAALDLTPGVVVESSTSLAAVIEQFVGHEVSFVVVNAADNIVGVVNEHDVLRAIHHGADLDNTQAVEVMSIDLVVADKNLPLVDAAHLMTANHSQQLMVRGSVNRVVSISDLMTAMINSGGHVPADSGKDPITPQGV